MEVYQMRNYIMNHPKYKNSVSWRARCMKMPVPQVVAIFRQFQQADYKKIEREMKKQEELDRTNYHQMDIFDWMDQMEDTP